LGIVVSLLIFGIIAVILVVLGISITRSGIRGIKESRASTHWPTTMGTIVSTDVKEQQPLDSLDGYHRSDYLPVVEYSYSVNEKKFTNGHRTFNDDVVVYGSTEKAQAAIEKYSVGKTVQVYYDPTNPGDAVLEPGKAGPSWRSLTAGILCLILTLVPILLAIAVLKNQGQ
jgi:hypothetical protein